MNECRLHSGAPFCGRVREGGGGSNPSYKSSLASRSTLINFTSICDVWPAVKEISEFYTNRFKWYVYSLPGLTQSRLRYMGQWVPWKWELDSSQRTGSHLYVKHPNREPQTDRSSRDKFPSKLSSIPNSARTPTRMGVWALCLWTYSSIRDSNIHR